MNFSSSNMFVVVKSFVLPFVLFILLLLFSTNDSTGPADLNIKDGDCAPQTSTTDYRGIVEWHFRRSRVLFVIDLAPKSSFANNFIRQLFSAADSPNHVPVIYFNWPNETTIQPWTTVVDRKSGVVVIGDSLEEIGRRFNNPLSRTRNNNRDCDFMFTIVSRGLNRTRIESELNARVMGQFFRGLWKDFNILKSLVLVENCGHENRTVGYFEPFKFVAAEENWGDFQWTTVDALRMDVERDYIVNNFQGYPLKINQFIRYPTAIPRTHIPLPVQQSYIYQHCQSDDWFGVDGLILRNLEMRLNFSKRNIPVPQEYGWQLDNGTFVGTIGELLRKEIDISFNGRFIKYYDTFEVDFMYPIFFDKFCIVAPKALRIPEYLRIFRCFDTIVWTAIVAINLVLGCIWYCTKKILFRIVLMQQKIISSLDSPRFEGIPAKDIRVVNRRATMKNNLFEIIIEMWNIMFAAPSPAMPQRNVERILLTACLLANLIITGIFQGSLTTAFSTVSYYKDIDTLQELDTDGLPIYVGSRSILDIFGIGGSPIIQSLAAKMTLRAVGNSTSLNHTAYERKSHSVERKADLNVIINTRYVTAGGRPLVHVVNECPRDYYVAYLTRTGWPLLPTFNWNIIKFFEAGLIQKWYEVTESAIIDHHRLMTPNEEETMKPLSLIDIQTSFYILGIGLALSTFVFLCEQVRSSSRQCTRAQAAAQGMDY